MSTNWYYVEKNDRKGPVDEDKVVSLIKEQVLSEESYVWKKGFSNWLKIKDVDELLVHFKKSETEFSDIPLPHSLPPVLEKKAGFDWENIDHEQKLFLIKIGLDRQGSEVEYGPYSLNLLKRLFAEKRVNHKTLIFAPGMENWSFLGEIPVYQEIFSEFPPVISDQERRISIRKPFVAKMFFHNNTKVFEGVCRDISVGGLQILVSDYPANVGDMISLNVHPDNSSYSFVASGKIVRLLDGNQGFSIRFSNLSEEAQAAIKSYISDT